MLSKNYNNISILAKLVGVNVLSLRDAKQRYHLNKSNLAEHFTCACMHYLKSIIYCCLAEAKLKPVKCIKEK